MGNDEIKEVEIFCVNCDRKKIVKTKEGSTFRFDCKCSTGPTGHLIVPGTNSLAVDGSDSENSQRSLQLTIKTKNGFVTIGREDFDGVRVEKRETLGPHGKEYIVTLIRTGEGKNFVLTSFEDQEDAFQALAKIGGFY